MIKPSDLHNLIPLGQGPGTRVFRAQDAEARALLLKTFSLAEAPDWKAQELFEREAKVLQHLNHPHLPQLLAYGVEDGVSYLIYPFIAGESLQQKMAVGWRPAQDEVLDLIQQLLETLIWLHDRQPPVIHRDIKPSNLILTEAGHLTLIDFGAVLQHLKPQGGSTVAGTFGYMAPEQLGGRALPASDLYGVGATLIHLLSGKAPGELPQERLWIKFEDHVQLSAPLTHWLKTLIHPVLEERCPSAREALARLKQARLAPTVPAMQVQAPSQALAALISRPPPLPDSEQKPIEVTRVPQGLSILLPRRISGQNKKELMVRNVMSIAFLLGILAFVSPDSLTVNRSFSMSGSDLTFIAGALGLFMQSFYRVNFLSSLQTHLTLSEEQLIVNFSHQEKSSYIPWSQIVHLSRKKGARGLKLVYRDVKTGKKRKLSLGETLEHYEQYWLLEMLAEKTKQT